MLPFAKNSGDSRFATFAANWIHVFCQAHCLNSQWITSEAKSFSHSHCLILNVQLNAHTVERPAVVKETTLWHYQAESVKTPQRTVDWLYFSQYQSIKTCLDQLRTVRSSYSVTLRLQSSIPLFVPWGEIPIKSPVYMCAVPSACSSS